MLHSAIENLVRNALFYSGRDGRIEVTLTRANDTAVITVRDNGQVRVHPARLTHVFVRRDGQWYLLAGQYTPIGKLTVR